MLIMDGSLALTDLEQRVVGGDIDPRPVSGRQEQLENLMNRTLWQAIRSAGVRGRAGVPGATGATTARER